MTAATIVTGWMARLCPTREQAMRLNQWAGALRFLWNRLLEREQAEYAASGKFLWKRELQPLAVAMKKTGGTEWLADLPAHAVLDTAARMDGALRKMVQDRKKGLKTGFPARKKKFVREAGIYLVGQATRPANDGRSIRVPKLGRMKLRGGCVPQGRLIGGRIMRDGDRWMLALQIETPAPAPMPATGVSLGMDVGLKHLATVFDGETVEHVAAPKLLRKAEKRLKRLQRAQSRRKKGSARRRAAAKRVATLHRKVRNQRKDFLHQLSHRLTAKGDCIGVETLNLAGMARALRLGKALADAGLGMLLRFVRYKADRRGRFFHAADRWRPSTKPCCVCGQLHDMPLRQRVMRCACGNVMDRDENASRNLRLYGQEARNRLLRERTRGDIGEQAAGFARPPVPVGEPRILADVA